jgi:UDP-N-acetylmuramyl pentapeptide phosphotransferase/UDP-N-acetylglucosamine-1-phosphate transferase
LLARPLLRALAEGGHLHSNYRGRRLPYPYGLLIPASALLALAPLALIERLGDVQVFYGGFGVILAYTLGVTLLGLIDDGFSDHSRGWRGHANKTLAGGFSTGALKACGTLGLALYVMDQPGLSTGRYLLGSAVLVLTTNLFNLLDLRPGRATKVFLVLGGGLAIGSHSLRVLWALGLFAGPALLAGAVDLRERAMLGDTGANLLGALAGLWLVLSLSTVGQLIALGLLATITIYGEFRSISELVDRNPVLHKLDSWGRPA